MTLWSAVRTSDDLRFAPGEPDPPAPQAFFGVRSCDLHAIAVQDRVFLGGGHPDPHYAGRRDGLLIVAVHCSDPADTCFCTSMGTGPRAVGPRRRDAAGGAITNLRQYLELQATTLGHINGEGHCDELDVLLGRAQLERHPLTGQRPGDVDEAPRPEHHRPLAGDRALQPGAQADEAAIAEHCRKHLGGFQVPKRVRILDEMPMTATGKLRKVELRQAFSEHFAGK